MYKITLAAARKNANMTQQEVAKRMKISKATLINWEKGKTNIGVAQFDMLCRIYNVPKDIIFLSK